MAPFGRPSLNKNGGVVSLSCKFIKPQVFFNSAEMMKGMDLFCASPASTAICSSMDQRSVIRPGSRVIDTHNNPHLRDGRRRSTSSALTPFSSQPAVPTRSKSYHHQSSSRKSSTKPSELLGPSPHGSSRYLLSNTAFFDFDPFTALAVTIDEPPKHSLSVHSSEYPTFKPSSSPRPKHQVVVLRVSLHCKGCEGKVKKHISKMEGVTSFSIDYASKKVTIIGNITPSGVLQSVSKVKNAQFWPSSGSSTASSSVSVGFTY